MEEAATARPIGSRGIGVGPLAITTPSIAGTGEEEEEEEEEGWMAANGWIEMVCRSLSANISIPRKGLKRQVMDETARLLVDLAKASM